VYYEPSLDRPRPRPSLMHAPGGAMLDGVIALGGLALALLSQGFRAAWAAPIAIALGGLVVAFRLAPLAVLFARLLKLTRETRR
jgi:predicted lipid-binding transport protein (Tim44 family)